MLKKNILATNMIYVATVHSDNALKIYEKYLDEIFLKIKKCEDKKILIEDVLNSKLSTFDFNRLTG